MNPRLLLALLLTVNSCAKKNPKPVHTEPWLAHPPPSASVGADAAAAVTTRYVLTEQSLVRFEIPTRLGKVEGKLTKVSGEIEVALGALAQSRGQVQVNLNSLEIDNADSADWLLRARRALDLADAGASPKLATFELTALDAVSPEVLEPVRPSDAGTSGTRRVRAVAEGNLLLNGFRVLKREPLEAEFGFAGDPAVPATLAIRSRSPFVISLETHEIHSPEPAPTTPQRHRAGAVPTSRDVRVSIELYGRKD